ncbi:hypothetical protein GI582_05330 [Sulfitobacter sp. BDSS02]|uniref:hypothetical protein n=1 Tax=Heliomarina sp. TaxID=2917556 RepID=UPI004059FE5E|nr:hypothetical protein [Sulfitobacter sp. BDSS02]MBR9848468.1 hypothetical protein [Paracoccaceae bacterium]
MDRSPEKKKDPVDFSSSGRPVPARHHQISHFAALSEGFRILLIQRRIRFRLSEPYSLDVAISPQDDAKTPEDDDISPRLDAISP